MGWQQSVGSLNCQVSSAKEPYKNRLFYQRNLIIYRAYKSSQLRKSRPDLHPDLNQQSDLDSDPDPEPDDPDPEQTWTRTRTQTKRTWTQTQTQP